MIDRLDTLSRHLNTLTNTMAKYQMEYFDYSRNVMNQFHIFREELDAIRQELIEIEMEAQDKAEMDEVSKLYNDLKFKASLEKAKADFRKREGLPPEEEKPTMAAVKPDRLRSILKRQD